MHRMFTAGVRNVCLIAASLFAQQLFGVTYWVDGANGNDANSGLSKAEAFQTVQKAFETERDNLGDDEIILVSGTHTVTAVARLNAYCKVRGETGNPEDVVLDGGGACQVARFAGTTGSTFNKKLVVSGITFTNGGGTLDSSTDKYNCLMIMDGAVVSNCVVRGSGIPAKEGDDPTSNLAAVSITSGGLLTHSVVSNCMSKGASSAVHFAANGTMRSCLIADCRTPNSAGGAIKGDAGGFIYDCVVSNNVGRLGCALCGELQMVSNTVFACNKVSFTSKARLSGALYLSQQDKGAVTGGMKIVDCHVVDNEIMGASCGGICVLDLSGLEVVGTEIARNKTDGDYGGAYAQNANVVFRDCTIRENTSGGLGGGLGGAFTVVGGVIEGNRAVTGGGICVLTNGTDTATISGVRILSNTALGSGGGISVGSVYKASESVANAGWALIEDCEISNNVASAAKDNYSGGGGVYFKSESISAGIVSRCRIVDNKATKAHGGGIFVRGLSADDARGPISVRSCFFKGNSAGANGGAVNAISCPELSVDNCTFAGNSATGNGKGLYVRWEGVTVRNSIIVAADMFSDSTMNKKVYFHNCCIPVESLPACAPTNEGNFTTVPGFADEEKGDYSLADGSPCIDIGQTLDWMDGSSKDVAGNPRVWIRRKGIPDIGAWEKKYQVGFSMLLK